LKTSGDNIKLCLTNEKPFFIYSHSCLTGSFDNWDCYRGYQDFDCVAEVLTCEMPNGAFACILNARYGLGSEDTLESPSGMYDESFFSAIFHQHLRELGYANHFSKEDNIWRINENGMRWCYYQTNLFGDPQLQIKSPVETPDKPSKPMGSLQGKANNEYSYVSRTTDPQGEQIYYLFDWDDGSTSGWLGPYESGEECTATHTWENQGSFNIKVKAKDILNHESEWSDPLTVSMPKVKNRLMMEKQIFKIPYNAFKLILDAILLCT
jgi:hypothetical protein